MTLHKVLTKFHFPSYLSFCQFPVIPRPSDPNLIFPVKKQANPSSHFTPLGLLQHSQEQYKDVISLVFLGTESIF